MRRLKLGILASHPIQYQAPLFRAIAKRDVELAVLFCSDHGTKPSFDAGFRQTIQYDVPLLEGYPSEFLPNWALRPHVGPTGLVNPELARRVANHRYDALILHGYNYVTSLLAIAVPRARRTKLLLRGDSNALNPKSLARSAGKQLALRAVFSRMDHFLVSGTLNAKYYAKYGVPKMRMTLAPFSVDNDYFALRAAAARPARTQLRRSLGVDDERPIFLYVAKLLPHKRPMDLLDAFELARRSLPAALVYVGDGELRPTLEREVSARNLSADVQVLGFRNQSELPELYAACDALVIPSEREPWGLVVNEAMAAGLAVAASDRVGCAPDLVKNNGGIFPMGDVRALARILKSWASDRERLAREKAASAEIISAWGVEQTADAFLDGATRALDSL